MNAIDQALRAYAGPQSPIRTARQAEHQVFSTVTARLSAAARRPGDIAGLASALHDNRRLWTRLAVEVADPENGLAAELRARIFYLAEFTHHQTQRVLAGEAEPAILVEINAAVMRGLAALPSAVTSAPVANRGPQ